MGIRWGMLCGACCFRPCRVVPCGHSASKALSTSIRPFLGWSRKSGIEIVQPDHLLFVLQEDKEISGELYVRRGRGYVESAQHEVDRSMPVDVVQIDAVYNPVRRANFTVQETRVGQRTDFDSLHLSVETNGAVSPEDAVAQSAALLQEHFKYFLDFGRVPMAPAQEPESDGTDDAELRDLLAKAIDDCGLSVRSINSLKNSSISTLGDLVRYTREDLLKVKNVGDKALTEIEEMLAKEDLAFGMAVATEAEFALSTEPVPGSTAEPMQGSTRDEEGAEA